MRLFIGLCLLALFDCHGPASLDQRCVKGRLITPYCEGFVIQILDGPPVGALWNKNTGKPIPNCIVANLDSLTFKGLPTTSLQVDSTFYFHYQDGGYPQKEYILCDPIPSITITAIAGARCP